MHEIRDLIFVDTETGGLDPNADPLVELTWAPIEGDPKTLYFGVEEIENDYVRELIKFEERGISGKRSTDFEVEEFLTASRDATMVAANPAFDMKFLIVNDLWTFHYRMLDVEAYAMGKLNLAYVPGMNAIYDLLREWNHELTEPDHTSLNDVLAMREAFIILRDQY